jgi:ABC-type multidrug transport system ATPase subunit
VKKGGVTAIIGPSSSGKTVLMKALANRAQNVHVSGKVRKSALFFSKRGFSCFYPSFAITFHQTVSHFKITKSFSFHTF